MSKSRKATTQSELHSLKKIVESLYCAGMHVDSALQSSSNNASDRRQKLNKEFYVYCSTLLGKISDDLDDILVHLELELEDFEAFNE